MKVLNILYCLIMKKLLLITLINYANIKNNLLKYIVDKNPEKQNKFLQFSKIKPAFALELKKVEINNTKNNFFILISFLNL